MRTLFGLLVFLLSYILFADDHVQNAYISCNESVTEQEFSKIEINFTIEENEAIEILANGGNVTHLCVDADNISYIRNVCVIAGRNPNFNQRFTACPEVQFYVERKGLTVRSYGREPLLTGEKVIRIEGGISRELLGSWDEYPITVRRDLERNFHRRERGNRTNFPVLDKFTSSKISNALRTLSKN